MVVIVGAGITGLSAAFELFTRRIPFHVFEASPRAGGLIRTDHVDGFVVEAGAESVLVQKPAALELCEAVGLTSRLIETIPPRTAFVLKHGKLHPLPSPSVLGVPTTAWGIAGYGLLSPIARARLALEVVIPRHGGADESIGSFFRRRFGADTVGLIAEPLLGGIHAGDIESLSMKSLFPRLVDAEANRGSVLRAFRRAPRPASGGGLFRTLAGGMGELVNTVERTLPSGSIQFDSAVARIARSTTRKGTWDVSVNGPTIGADAVILACPAYAAGEILESVDSDVAALCAQVPYASTASVALAWPRSAVTHSLQGSGFVVARRYNDVRITACTWVSSKWAGRAPADSVLLRAFIGGSHDPGAVDLTDAELVDTVLNDLSGVLGITAPPEMSSVVRWRRAGAQHLVGQSERVASIDARLGAHGGLFVAGSGFRAVGIPDCIADGRAAGVRAARCITMGVE